MHKSLFSHHREGEQGGAGLVLNPHPDASDDEQIFSLRGFADDTNVRPECCVDRVLCAQLRLRRPGQSICHQSPPPLHLSDFTCQRTSFSWSSSAASSKVLTTRGRRWHCRTTGDRRSRCTTATCRGASLGEASTPSSRPRPPPTRPRQPNPSRVCSLCYSGLFVLSQCSSCRI